MRLIALLLLLAGQEENIVIYYLIYISLSLLQLSIHSYHGVSYISTQDLNPKTSQTLIRLRVF